jgi:uncharacterized membrane protein YphA (DoxX/SURF4 family)
MVLRLILGGTFLYAGIVKWQSPQFFADSIASFRLLPVTFINPLAISLPVLEAMIGVMLIVGLKSRAAAFSTLALCALFAIAMISALARGLKIDCGCFGGGTPSIAHGWFSVGRDMLLGWMALVIARTDAETMRTRKLDARTVDRGRANP